MTSCWSLDVQPPTSWTVVLELCDGVVSLAALNGPPIQVTLPAAPIAGGVGVDTTESIVSLTALQALSGHRAVGLGAGGVTYASPASIATADVLGITVGAAVQGAPVAVQTDGVITEPTWQWAVGPVWLGESGVLTQTVPSSGVQVEVGMAISATQLLVRVQPAIVLFN